VNGTTFSAKSGDCSSIITNGVEVIMRVPGSTELEIRLVMPPALGPGTYAGTTTGVVAEYYEVTGTTGKLWRGAANGTTQIVLSKLDKTNHKVSGTFQFTAAPVTNASGTKTITSGRFTDVNTN